MWRVGKATKATKKVVVSSRARAVVLVAIGVVVVVVVVVAMDNVANADDGVITSRPKINILGLPNTRSDTNGTDGYGDRIGALAIEPLRLSLLGGFPMHPLGEPGGCRDSVESTGSLTGGSTLYSQRMVARNLLGGEEPRWNAPRLTLWGFQRGGCAIDGAVGGGLTFTVPIKRDVFFAIGAGAIYLPQGGPNGTAAYDVKGRADVVFARPGGRSFNIGVTTIRNTPSVSFGGVF
jgi:hypothetical protein